MAIFEPCAACYLEHLEYDESEKQVDIYFFEINDEEKFGQNGSVWAVAARNLEEGEEIKYANFASVGLAETQPSSQNLGTLGK